jgi:hypothetical protein
MRGPARCRTALGFVLAIVAPGAARAACVAPAYQVGFVLTNSSSEAFLHISIRPQDFAPGRLVCLAQALKSRYRNRKAIDVLIFSSPIAAKYYRPYEIERDGPITSPTTEGRFHDRDLHAAYTYDRDTRVEYIDLKPWGSIVDLTPDTRIPLPLDAAPHCKQEVNGRCLLILGEMHFPWQLGEQASGAVTVTGRIKRNGTVADLQVVDPSGSSGESRAAFVNDALQNLKTWRFEEASHEDALHITYVWRIDTSLQPTYQETDLTLPTQVTMRGNPNRQ